MFRMLECGRVFSAAILLTFTCLAANAKDLGPVNVDASGVAVKGFDIVAMYGGKTVTGKQQLSLDHAGATYYFSSEANRTRFKGEPEKFLPAFGGYCAYGVRMGQKLEIDPHSFVIDNGKLYMLLNPATKRLFEQEMKRNIEIANRLWPDLKGATKN